MISILDFFILLLYIAVIVLVVALIILVVKAIGTLNKVDKVVDDISVKSSKLDGLFNIVDNTTDALVNVSDTIITFIADTINNIFKRKKDKKWVKKD